MTDVGPLVCIDDIATMLDVHSRTVQRIKKREPHFPDPIIQRPMRWRKEDIVNWLLKEERKYGSQES